MLRNELQCGYVEPMIDPLTTQRHLLPMADKKMAIRILNETWSHS
jgi:hypothetical protein